MTTTELTKTERRDRVQAALAAGNNLAQENGIDLPTMGDAIWELMMEAAETLKRMPDPERGWLKVRSGMPEPLKDVMDYADPDAETTAAPPRKEAIDRMEEVLSWFQFFKGRRKRRRNLQVVFSLASGLPRYRIADQAGVHVDTLYRIRDEQIRAVAFELRRILKPPKEA